LHGIDDDDEKMWCSVLDVSFLSFEVDDDSLIF